MKRPLAYITAPWSENEFENTENAAKYCRAVYDAGFSPVCPTLFLPLFLRDEIPQEHTPSRPRTSARASAFSRKNSRRFWKTGVSATAGFHSLRSSPRWKP